MSRLSRWFKGAKAEGEGLTPQQVFGTAAAEGTRKAALFGAFEARHVGKVVAGSALMGKAATTMAAGLLVLMGGGFIASSMLTTGGAFTVKATGVYDEKRQISLSETAGFSNPSIRLSAAGMESMDNITYDWLPFDELEAYDGAHNGENYIAYTFYVKNTGSMDVDYSSVLYYTMATRNIENAMRAMVYYNAEPTIYAAPAQNGSVETTPTGTVSFYGDNIVSAEVRHLEVNALDRYTVVIWLEGEDPDCVNSVREGMMKMEMDFAILDETGQPIGSDTIVIGDSGQKQILEEA